MHNNDCYETVCLPPVFVFFVHKLKLTWFKYTEVSQHDAGCLGLPENIYIMWCIILIVNLTTYRIKKKKQKQLGISLGKWINKGGKMWLEWKWPSKEVAILVSMVFLENVCHCGDGFWGLMYAQATPSVSDYSLSIPCAKCKDSQLLPQHQVCLHTAALYPMILMD